MQNEELQKIFDSQKEAFARDGFPEAGVRIERLKRLRRMVVDNKAVFSNAIARDFGIRSEFETEFAEIAQALGEIDLMLRHLRSWMKPRRVCTPLTLFAGSSRLMVQPRGVIGIISPWNYPLVLSVAPMAEAIASGNRVMVKLSEKTPRFAQAFAEAVRSTFDPEEVAVLTGDVALAKAFSSLAFDLMLYTGNTRVGREVYESAARNLTPAILELGGKSPCVIAPGADLKLAVERLLVGKLINAGQTCIAPDIVWVERSRLEAFVNCAQATLSELLPDFSKMTSVINELHYRRVLTLAEEVRAKGGRVVKLLAVDDNPQTNQMVMRLAIDPQEHCRIDDDEIFGPLLLVRTYMEIDPVIEQLRQMPHKPLALYWFDTDKRRIRRVASTVACGGITVNDTLLHFAQHNLPFGGVGESGLGAYHGKTGFDAMSHLVPVFEQSQLNFLKYLNPPYSRVARTILRWMAK